RWYHHLYRAGYGCYLYGNRRYLFVCAVCGKHLLLQHGSLPCAYPDVAQPGIALQRGRSRDCSAPHQRSLQEARWSCRFSYLLYLKYLVAYYFWIKTIEPMWPGTEPLTRI